MLKPSDFIARVYRNAADKAIMKKAPGGNTAGRLIAVVNQDIKSVRYRCSQRTSTHIVLPMPPPTHREANPFWRERFFIS